MEWNDISNLYPVNDQMIWLNNCGITPVGKHIIEEVTKFLEDYARKVTFNDFAPRDIIWPELKSRLANILSCHPDEIAIIHNTAEGMNFISRGLSFKKGDEIVLLENEYPSNYYPWLHWKEKGIKIKITPMCETQEEFLDKFKTTLSEKTKLVSLSMVHWCTGMPLPIDKIGEICQKENIIFVLDGAQGVGIIPLNVKKVKVSFLAFSAWKWLMGPLGVGVLYVPQEKLETLPPVFIGSKSMNNDEQYLPYKNELKPNADRFTFSTVNINDWVYFRASLRLLDKIGLDSVRERIFALNKHLQDRLREIGFEVFADRFRPHLSGITVADKKGSSSTKMVDYLKENNVIVMERLGRIRFSPHIFNTFTQLDKVTNLLDNWQG